MNNKLKYSKLCEKESTIPIFSKDWWMCAVCGSENWDVILVEENGHIVASLPYFIKRTSSGISIQKAPLTQNNGIWIKYPTNIKYEKKLSYEKRLMNNIIDKIESLQIEKYRQYFHYSIENWLPFYWRGFSQTTRYTYLIENTSDLEAINNNFNSNIRNQLRKARREVEVFEGMEVETFFKINELTFLRSGMSIPYSLELLKRLDFECAQRNTRKVLYAADKEGNVHSAVYLVWDEDSVYYLMSGSVPNYRSSQSLTLLIYESIRLASKLGKKFDFEGSMKENIENFFRQFGAIQKPYHDIFKEFNLQGKCE